MAIYVFQKAKNITVVSPYVKNEIGVFTDKEIDVIPNPTPINPIKSYLDNKTIEFKLNSSKIVMILNGWGPRKNAKPAIRAFSQVIKSIPDAELHIFGHDFQLDGMAQQWAKNNKLDKNIIYHGPTQHSEILTFLEGATLLLHPALEECCPLTLIEAMSYGVPVIGGKSSGGVPWVLDEGNAGLLVDVSNPLSIAEKMISLLTDKQLYTEISNKSLQRVQNLFSQSSVVSAYEDIYKKVLSKNE
jgi:glycosyltransferase involved in cell wall biosynthesis